MHGMNTEIIIRYRTNGLGVFVVPSRSAPTA